MNTHITYYLCQWLGPLLFVCFFGFVMPSSSASVPYLTVYLCPHNLYSKRNNRVRIGSSKQNVSPEYSNKTQKILIMDVSNRTLLIFITVTVPLNRIVTTSGRTRRLRCNSIGDFKENPISSLPYAVEYGQE